MVCPLDEDIIVSNKRINFSFTALNVVCQLDEDIIVSNQRNKVFLHSTKCGLSAQ